MPKNIPTLLNWSNKTRATINLHQKNESFLTFYGSCHQEWNNIVYFPTKADLDNKILAVLGPLSH